MTTNFLERHRAEVQAKLDERAKAARKLSTIAANAEQRGDKELTPAEEAQFAAAKATIAELDESIPGLQARIAEIEELEQRNADLDRLARQIQPEPTPVGQREIRVGREEPIYRQRGQFSFFSDLIAEKRGDRDAAERLHRHHAETRDVGTSTLGDGLVPPQYLPQMYAEVLRAGRVTFDLARRLDMPVQGMTLTIPRGTTGTVVEAQSNQNTSVTEVDFDATDLVIPIRTYAGQNDLSRQAVERGAMVDEIVFSDLIADHNRQLNYDAINGLGTNGTHKGIRTAGNTLAVSLTTAGFAAFHASIANAAGKVAANRFMSPDVIIMHPRRWAWSIAQTDSDGRPMLDLEGKGANAAGSGSVPGEGYVGTIAGIPTYIDASIPTTVSTSTYSGSTEDIVIVARSSDLLAWDDGTRRFRFDDVGGGSLTSKLVVASYTAWTAEWHPQGIAIISGSSLSTTLG
jgi:HK97 family phage major capsid protein